MDTEIIEQAFLALVTFLIWIPMKCVFSISSLEYADKKQSDNVNQQSYMGM